MSASMLLATCRAPFYPSNNLFRDVDLAWSSTRGGVDRVVAQRIKDFVTAEFDEVAEAKDFDYLNTVVGDLDDVWEGERSPERLVEILVECARIVLDAIAHNSQEGVIAYIGNKYYIQTGGLSWGDVPTDLYLPVAVCNEIGIFNDPIPYPGS